MRFPFILVFLLGCATAAFAHDYKLGTLTIGHPHARPTAPSQPAGGGYLTVLNNGAADRLVSAASPVAVSVQMHSMRMEGDVMRMREVDAIELPPGKTVELRPGGLHLMLIGLKAPLVPGQTFPMTLRFEKAGEVKVEMKVDPTVSGPAHDKH